MDTMIEAILSEATTVSSYDIATREHVTREVRLVDLERERMGDAADGLSDEDIAQIILDRRQAEQDAAQAEENRQALITYSYQLLRDFDVSAFSRTLDDVQDTHAKEALSELLGVVTALATLGGYRGV